MSGDVKKFIEDWIDNHVHAEGYQPEGNNSEGRRLAERCRVDATEQGFSTVDLDEAAVDMIGGGDNLDALMANAIEEANDAECKRQSERDG